MKRTIIIVFYFSACAILFLNAANVSYTGCPVSEWKQNGHSVNIEFHANSKTEVPRLILLGNAKIIAALVWEEMSTKVEGQNHIRSLRNPNVVYSRASVLAEGPDGIKCQVTVSFDGHDASDFLRIDGTKVGVPEYLAASKMAKANGVTQTMVGGTTISWGWTGDAPPEPFSTTIFKEGGEIELKHSTSDVVVSAVRDESGTMESVVLDPDKNGVVLYPGATNTHVRRDLSHSVKANCK